LSDIVVISDTIMSLYDNSATARQMLETLAAAGPIRISTSTSFGQSFVPAQSIGVGVTSDAFINLNTSEVIWAISSWGTMFQMQFATIVAHELAHWALGHHDPALPPVANPLMNNPTYDYVGDTVRTEWQVDIERGATNHRATYQSALGVIDARLPFLNTARDYVPDGYVSIVRYGDRDQPVSPSVVDPNDVIDVSGFIYDSALLFGFAGEDTIKGTPNADYIYAGSDTDDVSGNGGNDLIDGEGGSDVIDGGHGNDQLIGGSGDDTIFGDAGDDFIAGGDQNDQLLGGAGNDDLGGGAGSDLLLGGAGADHLVGGDGNDLLDSGDGPDWGGWGPPPPRMDELFAGAGDDIIILKTRYANEVNTGDGNDQIWFVMTGYGVHAYISDATAGDSLYWNGYKLAGGNLKIAEAEQTGAWGLYWSAGAIGALGEYYEWRSAYNQLYVQMPDGSSATLDGFQNGDYGLVFDHDASYAQLVSAQYDSQGSLISASFNVPVSNIVFDNEMWNLEDLLGRTSALNTPGPETMPLAPLI
jgi:hypothetical protein